MVIRFNSVTVNSQKFDTTGVAIYADGITNGTDLPENCELYIIFQYVGDESDESKNISSQPGSTIILHLDDYGKWQATASSNQHSGNFPKECVLLLDNRVPGELKSVLRQYAKAIII